MARLAIGSVSSVNGGTSLTTNSPSATAGNLLVLVVNWLTATSAGTALTPGTPAGWSNGLVIASSNVSTTGRTGYSVYYKTAAGGVESPVFANPDGAVSNLYARGTISVLPTGSAFNSAATSGANVTNNSGASTTGATVPNTGTLSASSEIFTGVAIMATTGLANAAIAFSGGSWTTDVSAQDTSASVGALQGYKAVTGTSPLGAVYTWTADATTLCFQAGIAVFDAVAAPIRGVLPKVGPGVSPNRALQFQSFQPGPTTASVTVALTGVSASGPVGQLTASGGDPPPRGALPRCGPGVSPFNNTQFLPALRNQSLSATVTAALTGVIGTGSVGTVGPTNSVALTGNSGTGSVGTLAPAVSAPLTATAGTGSVGTAVPNTTISLTGVTCTGAVGNVSASAPGIAALTAVTGTGSVGNVGPAFAAAASGTSANGSVGALVPGIVIALTGTSGSGSVGTLTAQSGGITLALTGTSGTGSVGTVGPRSTVAASGVIGTGSVGSVLMDSGIFTADSRTRLGPPNSRVSPERIGRMWQ